MLVYVKTVYEKKYMRLPNISVYKNDVDADLSISSCKKWGIGIVSCDIIEREKAYHMVKDGIAELG